VAFGRDPSRHDGTGLGGPCTLDLKSEIKRFKNVLSNLIGKAVETGFNKN
jgi:hypothetical protein